MKQIEAFAAFLAGIMPDAPPLNDAWRVTLDSVACIAGGMRTPIGVAAKRIAAIASRGCIHPSQAAAAYGRAGAAMDADDTFMMLHFGVPTVAAALAAAEVSACDAATFLRAVAVGYEAAGRVMRVFGPLVKREGSRITGYVRPLLAPVPSVFGATTAAAVALGLSKEKLAHALAIAASNMPLSVAHKWAEAGPQEAAPTYKYVDSGACAAVGVDAALLAAEGITGILAAFEGSDSVWELCGFVGTDFSALTMPLGTSWQIADVAFKPWPSCRWLHFPLTALKKILDTNPVEAHAVESVTAWVPAMGCAPQHVTQTPQNWIAAEFSHPHSIAMMLLRKTPGLEWSSDDAIFGSDAVAMRKKITVHVDEATNDLDRVLVNGHFRRVSSAIELRAGGRTLRASTESAFGDPWQTETRLDDEALFRKLALFAGSDGPALDLALRALPTAPSIEPLSDALRALSHERVPVS